MKEFTNGLFFMAFQCAFLYIQEHLPSGGTPTVGWALQQLTNSENTGMSIGQFDGDNSSIEGASFQETSCLTAEQMC
jgi:hypothetical protein